METFFNEKKNEDNQRKTLETGGQKKTTTR